MSRQHELEVGERLSEVAWYKLAELNMEDPGDLGVYNFPEANGEFIKLSSGNKKISPLH